jgi:hypothetical protein
LVGLLGRGISPTQGLYLHRTAQHRKTRTHIHASSGIRARDPSVPTVEDSTCLRQRGHWVRPWNPLLFLKGRKILSFCSKVRLVGKPRELRINLDPQSLHPLSQPSLLSWDWARWFDVKSRRLSSSHFTTGGRSVGQSVRLDVLTCCQTVTNLVVMGRPLW